MPRRGPALAAPTVLASQARAAPDERAKAASAEALPPESSFAEALAGAYSAGAELSFEGLFAGENRRRVSLPTYPFQRQRYWLGPAKRRPGIDSHALLGTRHESAAGEVTFERELSGSSPAWLGDHRVFGRVVAPAALHGALAAAAATTVSGGSAVEVKEFRLHSPLVFDHPDGGAGPEDPGRSLQVVIGRSEESASRPVEIFSKGDGEDRWTLHAEGRVAMGVGAAEFGAAPDLDALRAALEQMNGPDLYRALASAEVDLGDGVPRGRGGLVRNGGGSRRSGVAAGT